MSVVETPKQCLGFPGADCQLCEEDEYTHECSKTCDIFETCHGHGRCLGPTGDCACYAGWTGIDCNVPVLACKTRRFSRRLKITLPAGPGSESYLVSVTLENEDEEVGDSVQQSVMVIGKPSSVEPLSIVSVSFSKWSFTWAQPTHFWIGEDVTPVEYVAEVTCGNASMLMVYNDSSSLEQGTVTGNLAAEWLWVTNSRTVTLTPEGTGAIAPGSSALVCEQGDNVTFSVMARNGLFDGPQSPITNRALAPPSQVQGLASEEIEGGVTVSWQEPTDTGYGDTSAPVGYCVETSICPSFADIEECIYRALETSVGNGLAGLNLTREVLEVAGETYYIRVTAFNEIGVGNPNQVQQSFMIFPLLLSPPVSSSNPLRIASGGNFVHVWSDGSNRRFDGILRVTLAGLEVVNASLDLHAVLFLEGLASQGMQLVLNHSQNAGAKRIEISVEMPAFSQSEYPCKHLDCPGYIQFFSRLSPKKNVALFLQYFRYSDPELVTVLPRGGPEVGGTKLIVRVRDFSGDETRQGAGLPSFSDSLSKDAKVSVTLECGNESSSALPVVSTFVPGMLNLVEAFGVYDLSFQVPASPCGAQAAFFRFQMTREICASENCLWHPNIQGDLRYQYRGPGIVDVSPSSGMINRGNKRVTVTIVLENVGEMYADVVVALGNQTCTPIGDPVKTIRGDSELVSIQVLAPEFPRAAAGILTLKVSSSSFGPFEVPWQFLAPPEPRVEPESFRVNGEFRSPMWLKKTNSLSTMLDSVIELEISSLSATYDAAFSSLNIWFGGSRSRISNEIFWTVGVNTKISFSLDVEGLSEGLFNMTLHVVLDEKVICVIEVPGDVEIRDTSIPRVIVGAVAPTEGPVFGGTFVLIGISGASRLGKSLTFKIIDEKEQYDHAIGNVLAGAISLENWETENAEFMNVMKLSAGLKFGSKLLVNTYANVVSLVKESVAPDDSGAFLVLQMPRVNFSGPALGVITSGDGIAPLSFEFDYVTTPDDNAVVVAATTARGDASGVMGGGYQLLVRLTTL